MPQTHRNGLTEWHLEHTRNLLTQLLWHPLGPGNPPKSTLLSALIKQYGVRERDVLAVFGILTVTRTDAGTSHCKFQNGQAVELAVNWGPLADLQAGGEVSEYAAFADDPVIGSRWVQHADEALLMILGHELAHYVTALAHPGEDVAPHGSAFRAAYRLIREGGVNPILEANAATALQQAAARQEARLLRKIEALRKMSIDATSNPHEAERALHQLEVLLEKHGLQDLNAATPGKPHLLERSVPVMPRGRFKPLLHCCHSVGIFCGVEAVIHTRRWRNADPAAKGQTSRREYLTWFGAPGDVAMAVYLSELLHRSLEHEEDAFRRSTDYRNALRRGRHAASLLASFREAFCEQLNERLRAARDAVENRWVEAQLDNRALILAKDAALQAAFRQRYPRLGTQRRSASTAQRHRGAITAGQRAAERVNLSRPLGTSDIKRLR